MIAAVVEVTVTVALGVLGGTVVANRGNQTPGRHRDHNRRNQRRRTGANERYANQLHAWNRSGRRRRTAA